MPALLPLSRARASRLGTVEYARLNLQADWIVRGSGATYLDIALPSTQRPDGAMARFWPKKCKSKVEWCKEDCVHYCLPGPVDAWSMLLYNLLLHKPLPPAPAEGARPAAPLEVRSRGPAKNKRQRAGGQLVGQHAAGGDAARRFFAINASLWLSTRGASQTLERCVSVKGRACRSVNCTSGALLGEVECTGGLAKKPWWPFGNCSGH